MTQPFKDHLKPGALVALFLFVLFSFTLSAQPYPGLPSNYLSTHLGLNQFPAVSNPLWGAVVGFLDALPFIPTVPAVHLFSAFCGALAVFLMYVIAGDLRYRDRHVQDAPGVHRVCGVAAALYLGLSSPVWYVATRSHPGGFHLLLVMSVLWLLRRYERTGDRAIALLFALVYGVGVVEFATFILLAPMAGSYLLYCSWQHHQLTKRHLLHLCGMATLGLLLYPLAAWTYLQTPAAEWRGFDSGFKVLWFFWAEQWGIVARSVPRTGWLLVAMVSMVPWLIALVLERRGAESTQRAAITALRLLVTAVSLLILFNAPLSPWRFFNGDSLLIVTPYIFLAMAFGYSSGAWYALIMGRAASDPIRVDHAGRLTVAIGVAIVLSAIVRNYEEVETRTANVVNRWAAQVVHNMGGRPWLITRGGGDDALYLAAHHLDKDIRIINVGKDGNPAYRSYVASLFDHPRFQSLAQVGLVPLLKEWVETTPEVERQAATTTVPEMWTGSGMMAVPAGVIYVGAPRTVELERDAIMGLHERIWSRDLHDARDIRNRKDGTSRVGAELCRQYSRLANDVGVTMETLEDPVSAQACYETAREFDYQNLSALINMYALEHGEGELAEERVGDELADIQAFQIPVSIIVNNYGVVRRQDALELLQAAWGVERVLPDSIPVGIRRATRAYMAGQVRRARNILENLLMIRPELDDAWALLGLIAFDMGDHELMTACMEYLEKKGGEWTPLLLASGQLALAQDNHEAARQFFERALARQGANVKLLEAIVKLDMKERSLVEHKDHLEWLLTVDPGNAWGNFALGILQLEQDELDLAESSFRKTVGRTPLPEALNNLAWILHLQGDNEEAVYYARWALRQHPQMASAWDTLGVAFGSLGQFEDAEQALLTAKRIDPEFFDPNLHLAEVMAKTDRAEAAMILAERIRASGLDKTADQREALDTLIASLK